MDTTGLQDNSGIRLPQQTTGCAAAGFPLLDPQVTQDAALPSSYLEPYFLALVPAQLHLERTLGAPCERVFAACVEADKLAEWWGPAGFTSPEIQLDLREGGRYRIKMQPPEGEAFHLRGVFQELEAPRRLVYTFVWEEPDPDDQETVVALTFERAGDNTHLVLDQGPFKTEARYELHRAGWTETLDRLHRALSSLV